MGPGTVKKKLKHVAEVLTSKRVRKPASAVPSTPTKKDTRAWEWHTPRRSQGPASPSRPRPVQPLPALLSFLSALSPRSKTTARATQPPLNPTCEHDAATPFTSDPLSAAPFTGNPPSGPFTFTAPIPSVSFTSPVHTSSFGSPRTAYRSAFVHDADAETIDLGLNEDADPDDQDGVDGNYHHVSPESLVVISLRLTHVSPQRGLRSSSNSGARFSRGTSWTNAKLHLQATLVPSVTHQLPP